MHIKKRLIQRAVVALAIAVMMAACGGGGEPGGDATVDDTEGATSGDQTEAASGPIVIGGILDQTGAAAPFGTAALRGAEIAIEQVNASGGVNGREIDFRPEDGGFDVGQSTALLQRFGGDSDVVAIIGPNSDTVTIPLTDAINQAEIVAVQTSGSEFRPAEEYGQWLFSVPVRNDILIETVVQQLAELGENRIGIVYSTSRDFAVAAKDDFIEIAGENDLEIVGDPIAYEDEDVDHSTIITTLESYEDLDAVFCSCLPDAAGPMIARASEAGLDVRWVSDASLLSPEFYELSQQQADGTLVATPFHPGAEDEAVQSFVQQFEEAHGDRPDVYAAYGYDAAMVLIEALEDVSGEVTRDAVRESLADVTFDGLTGSISFPEGQGASTREGGVLLVEMRDGEYQVVE